MTAALANYAAKKLLGSQMDKYKNKQVCGDNDPFFAYVTDRNGKQKKVKKQIPDYIPKHDADVLAKAKSRAYHLDLSLFNLFGIRFGWSSVVGIIPGFGDVFDLFMASRLVQRCEKVEGGLPANIVSQMWINVALDFLLGLVPFVGDLVDAVFKCNTRNVALLERHLKEKHGPSDKMARDRSGLEAFSDDTDPLIPGLETANSGSYEQQPHYHGVDASRQPPGPNGGPPGYQQHANTGLVSSRTALATKQPQGRSWFGFGGSRQSDVEAGQQTGTVQR